MAKTDQDLDAQAEADALYRADLPLPQPEEMVKPVEGRARRGLPRVSFMVLLAFIPTVAILGLILITILMSLRPDLVSTALTLDNYRELFGDSFAASAARNTLGFAAMTLFVSLLFGMPMAWLVERSDLPGKGVFYTVMTMGILIPGFFTAIGWLYLLHPRVGFITGIFQDWFGLTPSVATIPGMGFVQGLGLSPLIFIMTASSLRAMDSSLEESAQMSGASRLTTLRRVTIPLVRPGLMGAAIFVFTIAIAAFDVPLIIGLGNRLYTFSTYLFIKSNPIGGLPEYGISAAFAVAMIGFGLILSVFYTRVLARASKYQVVSGKSYRPTPVPLGKWKFAGWTFLGSWLLLALFFPLFMVIWVALQPFFQAPSIDGLSSMSLDNFRDIDFGQLKRGLSHTATLMVAAPTIALALSLVFSWVILRSKSRLRLGFDYVAFLPHAVPNVIFAFAGLIATLTYLQWSNLYGSLTLLVIIVALSSVSFGTRITNAAMIQIHTELEEAAYMSGATTWKTIRRITIPLVKPAFVYAWLWMALLAFRELTTATMLASADNITLSVLIFDILRSGRAGQACAISLIMIVVMFPLILLYFRLNKAHSNVSI